MLSNTALSNMCILVTGGGTGLGRSMAEGFLLAGAKVCIASRKLDVVQQTAKELAEKTGNTPLALQLDVRNYNEVVAVFDAMEAHFGQEVNGLVNNAAGNFISPTERLSPKAFDIVCDIVLKGSYNCTLEFGKRLISKQLSGRVLSIVTTYAFTGSAYVVPSAVAKAGVLSLTKSLAAEWGRNGIRLNAIAPGPFPTEGAWERLFPKAIAEVIDPLDRIPLGRLGKHIELSNLASYLMSDYAAYMNGECVVIDGGEWLQGAGEFTHLRKLSEAQWDAAEREIRSANK